MPVQFEDRSIQVKAVIDDETIAWLYEWANEIASQAARNCKMRREGDEVGYQLAGSYRANVDESAGKATIGSPMEAVYWEEWGTGEHADTAKNGGRKGRQGWWVYIKNNETVVRNTAEYNSRAEAEAVASSMRRDGFDAYATNGREPSYTLQNAFDNVRNKAIRDLERILSERMGK